MVNSKQALGGYFSDESIDRIFPELVSKISDKKEQLLIKNQLSEIRTFLIRYRHIPAHAGSRFDSLDQERVAANFAIHNIGCLTKDLMKHNLIYLPKSSTPEPEAVPF